MDAAPRPRRRWYQYSLRSLLILMLVVSIGMSYVAVRMQRARRHDAVVGAILEDDGRVAYDWQFDASGNVLPNGIWSPQEKNLDHVYHVDVKFDATLEQVKQLPNLRSLSLGVYVGSGASPSLTDAGLAHLRGLTRLRMLQIGEPNITEAGLVHIGSLKQLEILDLTGLTTTDACLTHLQGLTQLQELYLGGGGVKTDAGLAYLKGLTRLRTLVLHGGPEITDVGLQHITGLAQLRELDLSWTGVTDAGLDYLKCFPQLQTLNLGFTRVTDAGVERLERLAQLRDLNLSRTAITDAALEHLKGLTHLRLDGCTSLTSAGLKEFQKMSPNCRVD